MDKMGTYRKKKKFKKKEVNKKTPIRNIKNCKTFYYFEGGWYEDE